MGKIDSTDEQNVVEADLKTNWRWLSVIALEGLTGHLTITLQDDQRPSDKFVFDWDQPHAYAVRDESFTNFDHCGQGGPFRELTDAGFLVWAREATWTHDGEALRHWQIAGSDEIIDVASLRPPLIRRAN